MAKNKPGLTVVKSLDTNLASPPGVLEKTGATLWRTIMAEYDIADCRGREMLFQICRSADRAAEYGAIIDRDGPVISTKNGPREHPLAKHELAARSFVVRTLARLGLNVEPIKAMGRPGKNFHWRPDE
jgi:hypothetical protein